MTFAILSLASSNESRLKAEITWPKLMRHAEELGYSCGLRDIFDTNEEPHWKFKYNLIKSSLEQFDRIVYVEPHVLMRFDCPNLLSIVPRDCIGMFEEGDMKPYQKKAKGLSSLYNSDVIVASKEHMDFFSLDNTIRESFKPKMFNLPYRFNRLPETVAMTGESMEDSYLVNLEAWSADEISFMNDKFEFFKEHGLPKMRKRIFIDVAGALGDCVAMEPVVRYIVTKLEPESLVRIRTEFPEIFHHLKLTRSSPAMIRCVPEESQPPEGYCKINLNRKSSSLGFNLIHPLDFGSISAFGGCLPNSERGICLDQTLPTYPGVEEHILIHPGATWQSRTFPAWFWQAVIDKLVDAGYPVALIGKTYSDGMRGTVQGIDASRCLDIRDKLSLKELIAVIRDSKMLITNDSSPVHISGAFYNPTIMITSCKHPDFIWPQRSPVLNITLGKPIKASSPMIGIVNNTRVDLCEPSELLELLPEPDEVLRKVVEYFSEE